MGDGIALGVGADYSGTGVDPQSFVLYVAPKPGIGLAEAEARLDALLATFVDEGPEPAELERLKVQMRAAEIYDLDRQQSRARRIGAALATGLTLDDVAAWPALLQAVTPADVQAAARRVFRPEASVTGWLTAPAGGSREAAGRGAHPRRRAGAAGQGRDRHPARHFRRRHHRLALRGAFAADAQHRGELPGRGGARPAGQGRRREHDGGAARRGRRRSSTPRPSPRRARRWRPGSASARAATWWTSRRRC